MVSSRVLVAGLVVCLVLLPLGAMAAEYSLSTDQEHDVPDREVTFEGETFTVSSISRVSKGDELQINASGPSDKGYDVNLYNPDNQISDSEFVGGGNKSFSFDMSFTPGTYAVAIEQDGAFKKVHPVVIKAYDVFHSADSTVEKGDALNVTVVTTELSGEKDINYVEVVLASEDNVVTVKANETDDAYEASISTDGLSTGSYSLYAVVRGTKEVRNKDEILGFSDQSSVSVEEPPPTPTPTPSPTPTSTPPPTPTSTSTPPSIPSEGGDEEDTSGGGDESDGDGDGGDENNGSEGGEDENDENGDDGDEKDGSGDDGDSDDRVRTPSGESTPENDGTPTGDVDQNEKESTPTPAATPALPPIPSGSEGVRSLEQIAPTTQKEVPLEDATPESPGLTVTFDDVNPVEEIIFDSEGPTGNISISVYKDPPATISEQIISQLIADAGGANGTPGSAAVVTIANISMTSDSVEPSSATVKMRVSRDKVRNPSKVILVHKTANGTWEKLETNVTASTNGTLTLQATVESLSLFAIVDQSLTTPTATPTSTSASSSTPTPLTTTSKATPLTTVTTPTPTTTPSSVITPQPNPTGTQEATDTSGASGPGLTLFWALVAFLVTILISRNQHQ